MGPIHRQKGHVRTKQPHKIKNEFEELTKYPVSSLVWQAWESQLALAIASAQSGLDAVGKEIHFFATAKKIKQIPNWVNRAHWPTKENRHTFMEKLPEMAPNGAGIDT